MSGVLTNVSGTYTSVVSVKANVAGTWTTLVGVWANVAGTWTKIWPAVLAASPTSVSKSGIRPGTLSDTVTLTKAASGVWLTGGSGISVTSGTGTSFIFSSTASAGLTTLTRSGTYRFTAADGSGQIVDVPVSFEHIGSA